MYIFGEEDTGYCGFAYIVIILLFRHFILLVLNCNRYKNKMSDLSVCGNTVFLRQMQTFLQDSNFCYDSLFDEIVLKCLSKR